MGYGDIGAGAKGNPIDTPHIDALAAAGNPQAVAFPRPNPGQLDFSFSGLKTAARYLIDDLRLSCKLIKIEIEYQHFCCCFWSILKSFQWLSFIHSSIPLR